jgi:hypothetical protein
MCSRQQFFGVGAYAVFKSGAERILYPVQRSAFCQHRGPSLLTSPRQTAVALPSISRPFQSDRAFYGI